MTEDRIRMIREGLALLNPLKIKIEDEGHLHVGHAGAKSGGHFKLYIVSQSFNNRWSMARVDVDTHRFIASGCLLISRM